MSVRLRAGVAVALLAALTIIAPLLAPHDPTRQFSSFPYAPPARPHVIDADGRWHAPFVYAPKLVNPLERRYEEDRATRLSITDRDAPVFLLGADQLGRDVLSRTLAGARLSLGVSIVATLFALVIAAAVGAAAGYAGGWVDGVLMRIAEFVLVLPAIYVALALRGALPLVLSTAQTFGILVVVFGLAGWPAAARGVRGIVRVERGEEYAEAARALGASTLRILARHLLPATFGFLLVQALLLVPAFVIAEATLSFVGFGFTPPSASWGVMLMDAAAVQVAADAPWLLVPAAAIVVTIGGLYLLAGSPNALRGASQNSKLLNTLNLS